MGEQVANRWTSIRGCRHIDRDLPEKLSLPVENLDAAIATVRNVHLALGIDGNVVRRVELAGFSTRLAPGLQPGAVPGGFGHPRVDIAVADVRVARRIPRYVGDL